MARTETILTAFVASPSDMGDERAHLEEVVAELNVTWSATLGVRIELVKWETHSHPSLGADAQDVINRQLPQDYDLFIGILGNRFGTATQRYGSGTEEEFELARTRRQPESEVVEIMMYFKETPIVPSLTDLEELKRVLEFRAKVQGYGALTFKFASADEFDKLIRLHLSRKVQVWLKGTRSAARAPENPASTTLDRKGEDDDDDMGLLDAIEAFQTTFVSVNSSIAALGTAASELGERMQQRSEELGAIPKGANGSVLDQKAAKRVVSASALDFEHYADATEAALPVYKRGFSEGVGYLVRAVELAVDFGTPESYEADRTQVRGQLDDMRLNLAEATQKASEFRRTISVLPRVAKDFNKARRRALGALDATLAEFEGNVRFLDELKV